MNKHADSVRYEAFELVEEGEYSKAFNCLLWLTESFDNVADHEMLATVLLCLGAYEKALERFQIVLERDPEDWRAAMHIALIYAASPEESQRDSGLALRHTKLAQAVLRNEESWHLEGVKAAVFAEMGEFGKAASQARHAFNLAPLHAQEVLKERMRQYLQGIPFRLSQEHILWNMQLKDRLCETCHSAASFTVCKNGISQCLRCARYRI